MTPAKKKLSAAAKPAASVNLSSLWNIAGFNLRMLELRLMRSLTERLGRIGLTPASATVLLVLESNPGMPLGRLADTLIVQRPNMTKLVKRLEARKLIGRNASDGDRRRISLGLTPTGKRHATKVRAILVEHDASVLSALSPAERTQFMQMIGRMFESLENGGKKRR
jgi:DNA-binding MarR family transcriptional regulator